MDMPHVRSCIYVYIFYFLFFYYRYFPNKHIYKTHLSFTCHQFGGELMVEYMHLYMYINCFRHKTAYFIH